VFLQCPSRDSFAVKPIAQRNPLSFQYTLFTIAFCVLARLVPTYLDKKTDLEKSCSIHLPCFELRTTHIWPRLHNKQTIQRNMNCHTDWLG